MPRYYFHVREADTLSVDLEGAVLQGDAQAIKEAVQAARETLVEKFMTGEVIADSSFEVVLADGHLIAVIPVSSVVKFQKARKSAYERFKALPRGQHRMYSFVESSPISPPNLIA